MINIKTGILVKSTELLNGTVFEKAEILITEYNEKGAMGLVVNKPFPRKLNELEEFKNSIAFPIYDGGPVDREHLFFIHRRSDLIQGGTAIDDTYYMGGNFKQAVRSINDKTVTEKDIQIFIGYCGWDHGQLEAEIEEGSFTFKEN